MNQTTLIHMALADNGEVVAHFIKSEDAREFCATKNYCHVPFNLANRDNAPAPVVGSTYKA